jgi:serine/threonine protein phosphatase PrpC
VDESSGALVVAVADGLGSRPLSQLGAAWAAESACCRLADSAAIFGQQLGDEAKNAAVATIAEALAGVNADLRRRREVNLPDKSDEDIATTLCAGVLVPLASGAVGVVARIGDAAAWIVDRRQFTPLFDTDRDGALNIVDGYVPSAGEPQPTVQNFTLPLGAAIIFVTDGVDTDIASSTTIQEWLSSCWKQQCDSLQMLNSVSYQRQGSTDDRTVVWVSHIGSEQEAQASKV